MQSIKQVQEFHETFKHPVALTPTIPDRSLILLRLKLLREECDELQDALTNDDIVGTADALGDIQYVLDGTFLVCGLHNYKEKIITAIHESNMSKACTTRQDAEDAIDEATLENGSILSYEEAPNGKFILYREDGKIMKGSDYRKPDLNFVKHE